MIDFFRKSDDIPKPTVVVKDGRFVSVRYAEGTTPEQHAMLGQLCSNYRYKLNYAFGEILDSPRARLSLLGAIPNSGKGK